MKFSNRFTAYSSYPVQLKLGRMIMNISPLDRSGRNFRFHSRGAVGARLLKSLKRFTAYSVHPIELELDRMILDISPLSYSKLDFSISFQGALWGRGSCNIQIVSQPTILM